MSFAALAFQGQQITKPLRDRSKDKSRASPNPYGNTKLSVTRAKILAVIAANRAVTRGRIIAAVGCSSGDYRNCAEALLRHGKIEFIGHANYGHWRMK